MAHSAKYKTSARKELDALPGNVQVRISAAVDDLEDNPRPPGCIKLKGRDEYRIRVGDYRVIYEIHDTVLIVLVVKVAHRGNKVYR